MAFKNKIGMYTRQGKMDSIKETAAIQTSKEHFDGKYNLSYKTENKSDGMTFFRVPNKVLTPSVLTSAYSSTPLV